MVRTSSCRVIGVGVKFAFAGRSVNGTTVSPCASAGSTHSGRPRAARPATANPLFSNPRRVVPGICRTSLLLVMCRSAELLGGAGGLRSSLRRFLRALRAHDVLHPVVPLVAGVLEPRVVGAGHRVFDRPR